MQAQAEAAVKTPDKTRAKTPDEAIDQARSYGVIPIPNPRGTQTVPQPKPTHPRTPDGRFAPEFRAHPHPIKT
ncbi:MAG: hypothetical protein ABR910_06375 [Acidobacteriaceae bacterium]|jgi:hypothetical protein